MSKLTLSGDLKMVTSREGAFVLNVGNASCFVLNEFGARVFERIDRGDSIDEIVAEICSSCGKPEPVVRGDLTNFVTRLIESGLATVA